MPEPTIRQRFVKVQNRKTGKFQNSIINTNRLIAVNINGEKTGNKQ